MKNKSLLVLEIVWIVVGAACIVGGIKYALGEGGYRTYIFFFMAVVSFAFAWVRHSQRKSQ